MTAPRLLDLFCGDGGAAAGYMAAGFDVTGIDVVHRRHYPGRFILGDALALSPHFIAQYDVVHASPPCQAYSHTRHSHNRTHPELIEPTRALLLAAGIPYVIENVPEAPLRSPTVLCGAAFGLTALDVDGRPLFLRRHRLFESSSLLLSLPCQCAHYRRLGYKVAGVYGGGSQDRARAETTRHGGYTPSAAVQRALMGVDLPRSSLVLAIPPAYTEHVGRQLLPSLSR